MAKRVEKKPSLFMWKLCFLSSIPLICFGIYQLFMLFGMSLGLQNRNYTGPLPTYETMAASLGGGLLLALIARMAIFLLGR